MDTRIDDKTSERSRVLDRIDHEEMADAVEHTSPEGRPAHPRMGPWQVALLVAGLVAALLIVALVVALLGHVAVGVAVASVGVIVFLMNPTIWAGAVRSAEWSKAVRYRAEGRTGRPADDGGGVGPEPLRVPPRPRTP